MAAMPTSWLTAKAQYKDIGFGLHKQWSQSSRSDPNGEHFKRLLPGPNSFAITIRQKHILHQTSCPRVSAPLHVMRIKCSQSTVQEKRRNIEALPFTPVNGPGAWWGSSLKSPNEHTLSQEEIAEIDSALEDLTRKELRAIGSLTREDFSLPRLEQKLLEIQEEVVTGKGFYLIRGLPVWRLSQWESAAAFWMIGTYFGWAVPQNRQGHMISHVRDVGADPTNPTTRIYMTNAAQPYHTDSCDIVGLLCLHPAKSGGLSSFTSSVAIHNVMLTERPDLVRVLAQPFTVDRKGEVPEGKLPYYSMPVFHYHGGHLTVIYARGFIQAAKRFPEVPRLSPLQIEALDKMDELAARDGLRFDMELKRGDMQFLHNHQIVHARGEYKDYEEEDCKRHLLRLWLSPPNGRPLPPVFAERYGTTEIGKARGGIRVAGNTPSVPVNFTKSPNGC